MTIPNLQFAICNLQFPIHPAPPPPPLRRGGEVALFLMLLCFAVSVFADDAPPRSLDARLKIELFAEQPQIVTPTGIDVDHQGRVWAIESNTHFPPKDYKGHPTDRLLVMSDTDGDGKADRIVVFTDELKNALSVAVLPIWFSGEPQRDLGERETKRKGDQEKRRQKDGENEKNISPPSQGGGRGGRVNGDDARKDDGSVDNAEPNQGTNVPRSPKTSVYVVCRSQVLLFHDDDGDAKADRKEQIARLETATVYPHNGLGGIAVDPLGWFYFGCGMNHGAEYKLIGSDGTTLTGNNEGGNLYRCRLDGSKLERWATGFWNPHASCFDAFGRMFTVDNDPDSRPPCRLLHIIQGGDYGYRWRNGRAGLHPFTSWNGEIPGTLPMVAGTGEAPSGILAYESDGFPEEYIGNLIVTSWGDHRIDRFRLKPKGASFTSLAEPVIIGGEYFRPVGIACAPDGSLYCTDWVKRDYNLHGNGRVWRISATMPADRRPIDIASLTEVQPVDELASELTAARIEFRRTAARSLKATGAGRKKLLAILADGKLSARARVEALWAVATVPLEIEDFRLGTADQVMKFAGILDQVYINSILLIGTPQFSLKRFLDGGHSDLFRDDDTDSLDDGALDAEFEAAAAQTALAMLTVWDTESEDAESQLPGDVVDPFLFATTVTELARRKLDSDQFRKLIQRRKRFFDLFFDVTDQQRLACFLAARRAHPRAAEIAQLAFRYKSGTIRRVGVQWIAEERFDELRPKVESLLDDPKITSDLFLATLAALEILDGIPSAQFDKTPAGKYVLPLVKDGERPGAVRALALRMVDPADPALDGELLGELVKSDDQTLRLETVRTLQSSPVEEASSLLRAVALDEKQEPTLRAEAVVGLARGDKDGELPAEARELLLGFLNGDDPVLRSEALRSLRGFVARDSEVREAIEKLAKTSAGSRGPLAEEIALALGRELPAGSRRPLADGETTGGDAAAGRRVFFHSQSAGCYKCHTINGRGGKIGPNLSTIGRSHSREKLITSILEPGKEIAPEHTTWLFETAAGKVLTGIIVHENERKTIIGDTEGKTTEIKTIDIVERIPQQKSIMPEKLTERMTPEEFRDLLAFLESLK